MPYHPLCPVHSRDESPEVIWDGRSQALAGPAYAIGLSLKRMLGREDVEVSYHVVARPELPPAHPHQFLIMPVEVAGADPDFTDFGNGAFLIPAGSTIEKSTAGELCVLRADPERHTQLSSRPIPGLN